MAALASEELRLIDAYWRAANYLSVGQIYLLANPLLREPLTLEHVKPRLLGHWGTTPGLNLLYAHMNRAIRAARPRRDLRDRPGPRRPRAGRQHLPRGHLHARSTRTSARTRRACAGCSGSSPSPAASRRTSRPRRPGSIHEGGELGYALVHAYGAAFDNPDLLALLRGRRRRGRDRPAGRELALEQVPEPGARRRRAAGAAPERLQDRQPDGARAHPATTSCARCSRATATSRCFVEGDDPAAMHQALAAALDDVARRHRVDPGSGARAGERRAPALADDRAAHAEGLDRPEGGRRPARRGHVPVAPGAARQAVATNPEHLRQLEEWMRSLPAGGAVRRRRARCAPSCAALAPRGRAAHGRQPARQRRPAAARTSSCPTSATTRSTSPRPARTPSEATRVLGTWLRDVMRANEPPRTSASSAPTRRPRTGSARCSRRPTAPGWPSACRRRRPPRARRPRDGGLSASTSARAGWRATC